MQRRLGQLPLLLLWFATIAWPAQQAPPAGQPAGSSSPSKPNASKADNAPLEPASAEKDIAVADYYIHKGDPDAAIPRLEEAIRLKPHLAKPRLTLAEVYEKKGDKTTALKYYKEYLGVFPSAPDAKKVQRKIEKLSSE